MAKKTENLLDCEAILSRVNWSLKLTLEQIMEHIRQHRMDAFREMIDPRTGGMIILGKEGVDRFWRCARRYLDSYPEKKTRTSLDAFVEHLRHQWAQLFLKEGKVVSQANTDLWLTNAYDATAQAHEPATHYIPCGLIFSKSEKNFTLGPVTFFHESEFFRRYGEEFEKLRDKISSRHHQRVEDAVAKDFPAKSAATLKQSAQWGNYLTGGLLESFKCYNWFAVIEVGAAHKEVSYDRALFSTRGALNIIKVLLGSYYTNRLHTADDHSKAGKAATLTRDANGELGISLSSTPIDNVVGDQWFEILTKDKDYQLLSRVLSLCAAFDRPPPLCVRLMDAFSWFGDAVAEKFPAAKIVKFVNAIERICGTGREFNDDGKERGVTGIVLTRSSILYSFYSDTPYSKARKEITAIYNCRSKLVHGSVSPFDDEIAKQVNETDRITNIVLLSATNYFESLGIEDLSLDADRLRAAFLNLEKWNADGRPHPM